VTGLGSCYDRRSTLALTVRKVVAAVLFALTGALLLLAWAALDNLWADYQDSPDSTYIEVAAIELGLALVCAAGGVWALRSR
jgi:hypothetical protein